MCSTLAERHHKKFAYTLATASSLFAHNLSLSRTIEEGVNFLADDVKAQLFCVGIVGTKPLHRFNIVTFSGITYRCKMYMILRVTDDEPVFG